MFALQNLASPHRRRAQLRVQRCGGKFANPHRIILPHPPPPPHLSRTPKLNLEPHRLLKLSSPHAALISRAPNPRLSCVLCCGSEITQPIGPAPACAGCSDVNHHFQLSSHLLRSRGAFAKKNFPRSRRVSPQGSGDSREKGLDAFVRSLYTPPKRHVNLPRRITNATSNAFPMDESLAILAPSKPLHIAGFANMTSILLSAGRSAPLLEDNV